MRYAATKALLLIVLSIIFASYFKLSNIYYFIFFVLSILSAFLTKGYSLYIALFLASCFNFNIYNTNQKALKGFPLYDTPLKIQAQIIEEPIIENNRYTARVLKINNSPLSAKIFLYVKNANRQLSYGDIIEVNSKISDFDFPRNPDLIDYNNYFYKQGYIGNIFTTGPEIRFVKLVKQKQGNKFIQHLINPMRRYFFKTVDQFFDKDEKDLLLGMLIGETRGMSKTMRTTFADAGVAHILAVSGLNVAIMIGVLLLLLPIFRIRGIWELIAIIIITLLFLSIVGFKPSAFRAGLMAICASLGLFLERRYDALNGVFIAAIFILLLSPQALFDIGFQLSFSAVIVIILIAPKIYDAIKGKNTPKFIGLYIILPSIVSFAACIGTAPIILYHFFRLPVLSVFANLLIVPLVSIATPLGFLVVLINLFWHGLSGIFANTLWLSLKLVILISNKFANLSFAVIEPGRPSILLIILFYLTITMLLFWKNNLFRKISLAIILIGINVLVWQKVLQPKELSVTYLDNKTGDTMFINKTGDAMFINLPNNRKMVIDAGEDGEIISSYLKSKGIKTLDLLCISHPHLDHYGGARKLITEFKIKKLLIATKESKDTMYTNLIDRFSKIGSNILLADSGETIDGLRIIAQIFSPNTTLKRIYSMDALNINDISIVLKITYNNISLLFPGDLDDADIINNLPVQAQILKSPHHGSKNANSQLLFSTVKPQYLIISGRKNISQFTSDLIDQNHIKLFNLRKGGAIVVEVKENKVIFTEFNGEKFISKNIPNK
jgi:competence protein ComEC